MLVGKGIAGWGSGERQTRRYGVIQLSKGDFNQSAECSPELNVEALTAMKGRVRLTCKIIEARDSGHIGDLFLGIKPSTPGVGEEIEIGVGYIDFEQSSWEELPGIVLKPEDGRARNWINPHILYRLHDQTIELYAEETADPCHSTPNVVYAEKGLKATGDGYIQVSGEDPECVDRIYPQIQPLGSGMFSVSTPSQEGEDLAYSRKKEN